MTRQVSVFISNMVKGEGRPGARKTFPGLHPKRDREEKGERDTDPH